MTLWGPHGSICWMRFIAPPPAWKKKQNKKTAIRKLSFAKLIIQFNRVN